MPAPIAAIPFILAGLGSLITAYTAGTAVVNTMTSQSKQAAISSEARRDAVMASRAPAPPPPKRPPPPPPKRQPPPPPPAKPPKPPKKPKPTKQTVESTPQSGSESSSGSFSAAPPPPPPIVKAANIDTVLFNDEEFSEEFIVDLLFEDIAGQELLMVARNDTVNGQDVKYQPIKNLNILQDTYNPTKLLGMFDISDAFFGAFAIDLRSKIPSSLEKQGGKNYYITETGDLVVELTNILVDEQVEIQVADSGTIEELGI